MAREKKNGKKDFRKVFLLTLPVAAAYLPVGITLGIYLSSSGIPWYWAPFSALIIFAGSIEFLTVDFINAGFPFYLTAWTTLVVNFRHVFYGFSLPIHRLKGPLRKIYGVWALTDESYGIISTARGQELNGNEIITLQVFCHIWWFSGSLSGALLGLLIPVEISGFGFALTAMFVILAVDAIRENPQWRILINVILAALPGIISDRYLFPESFLAVSLMVYFIIIVFDYIRKKHVQ